MEAPNLSRLHLKLNHIKNNSKWIKDLNIKAQSIKHPEKKIGKPICELGLKKKFLRQGTET